MAREQVAREQQDNLRRIGVYLQVTAQRLNLQEPERTVNAVLPDPDDPLGSVDPTPDSDMDFPVGGEEFWSTWRIGIVREPENNDYASHNIYESDEDE